MSKTVQLNLRIPEEWKDALEIAAKQLAELSKEDINIQDVIRITIAEKFGIL